MSPEHQDERRKSFTWARGPGGDHTFRINLTTVQFVLGLFISVGAVVAGTQAITRAIVVPIVNEQFESHKVQMLQAVEDAHKQYVTRQELSRLEGRMDAADSERKARWDAQLRINEQILTELKEIRAYLMGKSR